MAVTDETVRGVDGAGGSLDGRLPDRDFTSHVRPFWHHLRYFVWLLWLCRIPLLSALLGLAIFGLTAPAQDMFLEIPNNQTALPPFLRDYGFGPNPYIYNGYIFWAVFHLFLVYFWAVVLYFWSCWMIKKSEDDSDPRSSRFRIEIPNSVRRSRWSGFMRAAVPLALTASCFVAILISEISALRNLHSVPSSEFESLSAYSQFHLLLIIQTTIACAALCLSFRGWTSFVQRPVTIHLLPIVLAAIAAGALVWWLCILLYVENWEAIYAVAYEMRFGAVSEQGAAEYNGFLFLFLPSIAVATIVLLTSVTFYFLYYVFGYHADGNFNFWIISILLSGIFIAFLFVPGEMIARFPFFLPGVDHPIGLGRALLAPLILSAWVPLLTFASYYGQRSGVPILGAFVAFVLLANWLLGDAHNVRRIAFDPPIAKGTADDAGRQLSLDRAVRLYKKHNCGGEEVAFNDDCQPIVVAASGGASRAGFFTASVLGNILDRDPKFAHRLFAISSVSGSSLGATMFAAALHEVPAGERLKPPCKWAKHEKASTQWYREAVELRVVRRQEKPEQASGSASWQACMQVLLSGDFLSPVLVDMAYKDPIGLRLFGDRASSLERAWERHFWTSVSESRAEGSRAAAGRGMERSFLSLAPDDTRWRPLLIANATSGVTGRRLLVSHLKPTFTVGKRKQRLFEDAYDYYEISNTEDEVKGWIPGLRARFWRYFNQPEDIELRVSTVAGMSSRFPVVSPHGNIRNKSGKVVDRIVDGGYFENFGATSAYELVDVLARVYDAKPVVILITNEPSHPDNIACISHGSGTGQVPLDVDADKGEALAGLLIPVQAIMATRTARGRIAAVRLCEKVSAGGTGEDRQKGSRFVHVRVFPDQPKQKRYSRGECVPRKSELGDWTAYTRELSVSWWLSKPLQHYLDCQLNHPANVLGFDRISCRLGNATKCRG
ncbi:MAG: hypothetical protein RLZ98_2484 [Pseudomonadota bacterium]|jgi:uncharacterized membrane protein